MTSVNGLSSSSASDVESYSMEEYGEDAGRAKHVCMEPRRLRAVTSGLRLVVADGPIWSGHDSALRYKHQEDVVGEEDGRGARQLEEKYSYAFLSNNDLQTLRDVLQGHVTPGSLPRLRSRVVKMFISSTFTDTQEERNALTKDVYPRLRKYCREKHGTDFLAVDMRWGVAAEASDDHSALDECMTELHNCQQHSLGPNFAVLLGQKYGSRPVAPSIVLLEFEAIRDALVKAGCDVTLLDTCYRRDINVTPSLHRLKPASQLSEQLKKPWNCIASELYSFLEHGGKLAVEAGEISTDSLRRLTASVTEHETYAGIADVPMQKDRDNNCIVYLREIEDLQDNLEAPNAHRYIDLDPGTTEVSSEPYLALKELRDKVKGKVCSRNTKVFHVRLHEGINREHHADYLQTLCNHFYHTARFLVDENMKKRDLLSQDELTREVIQHWTLAMARCETFGGRQQEMARIEAYLKGEGSQALVLHGVSGSGKTSLMASAAAVASKVAMEGPGPHRKMAVVLRFVGTTPRSSTRQQLLYSLCHQIAFVANRPRHKVPEDPKTLSVYLLELLERGEFNGELVLLVDSLPQMASDRGVSVLGWLPSRLAQNVKVVVSCVPGQQLEELVHKIGNPEQFLAVLPLSPSDSESVVKELLAHQGRAVTLPQWRVLMEALNHCTLPLFLTLTVQATSRWRSYDEVQVGALQYTVEASIHALFDRLERRHGKVFVSHALAYVTATPSGLSEPELEDILSLDDEVLNSVFVMWEPPVRRLPPSLWPRLAGELSDFLVEREADSVSVLGWFHRQFMEVAIARYLQPLAQTVYTNMADYYSGKWSGEKKKPFTYLPLLMKRLKLVSPESSACRYVPEQPLVFETEGSEQPRYNVRKLTQLPFCLLQCGSIGSLKASCLCNYTWLHTKLKATSLQHLLADFMFMDDIETTVVADALRMSGSALALDPDTLGTEISGRLLTHAQRMPAIRELVLQCDLEAQRRCALVPNCQIYSAPGGPLQYECELDDSRGSVDVNVFQSPDGILLTAKPFHSVTLKVWELGHGELRQNLTVPVGESWPTKDGRHLVVLKGGRRLVVLKTCSGETHGEIAVEYGSAHFVTLGNRYMAFTSDRGIGPSVVDLEEACLVHKFSYHSSTLAFNANEDLLIFNSGTSLLVFSLPLMERRCVTSVHNVPQQVQFMGGIRKCMVMTKDKQLQSLTFDFANRSARLSEILIDVSMLEFVISHTEEYILARAARCLYLIDAKKECVRHRLQKMPPGVFVETMSVFTGAGFSPNDDLVVASRYTYVAVWNARNGQPVRMLQASISPILKIFTSSKVNKAVSLLKDNTVQVWNLDNLDKDVLHANEVVGGPVKGLAVCSRTSRVVCYGHAHPEVKVVDLADGRTEKTLEYSLEEGARVEEVVLSPRGNWLVTRGHRAMEEEEEEEEDRPSSSQPTWSHLYDDIVWDMNTYNQLYQAENSRYVIFRERHPEWTPNMALVVCDNYVPHDWTENQYSLTLLDLQGPTVSSRSLPLPPNSEFLCAPIFFCDVRKNFSAVVSVVQTCQKPQPTDVNQARTYDIRLLISRLGDEGFEGEESVRVADLLKHADPTDRFVLAHNRHDTWVLLHYVKGVDHFEFDTSRGCLVCPPGLIKGSMLYDPIKRTMMKHFPYVLTPESDLTLTRNSRHFSTAVDNHLQVFNRLINRKNSKLPSDLLQPSSVRMALDGRYVVGLTPDLRALLVVRPSDGAVKGRLFIHGKAACVEVAENDRTIVVGCQDGRVMIVSLILEFCDPVMEFVQHLPSRSRAEVEVKDMLQEDVTQISSVAADLRRLSQSVQEKKRSQMRKPCFLAVSNAALITLHANRQRSQACSIQ